MAFAFIYLSLLVACAQAGNVLPEWKGFKERFARAYTGDEEVTRFQNFKVNLDFIAAENKKGLGYTLGITEFADRSAEELGSMHGLWQKDTFRNYVRHSEQVGTVGTTRHSGDLPAHVDWEEQGATTPVQNENMPPNGYGACWAFAATAALESAEKIVNGRLLKLSEQQVVDCSGAGSCTQGGDPGSALEWFRSSGSAICTETSYPYTCFPGATGCSTTSCTVGLPAHSVSGYTNVQRDEQSLMAALLQQPVVGAMAGAMSSPDCDPKNPPYFCPNHPGFQFYTGGIYSAPDCSQIDHAVLIVGYGMSESGKPYWKIKNSYGSAWGIDGYALLKRGPAGQSGPADGCGVPGLLAYPNVRKSNERVFTLSNDTSKDSIYL